MSDVETNEGKRRRNKRWPEALKREIVAASHVPGTSVSAVARQYDVAASQVFDWRRRLGGSSFQPRTPPSYSVPQLIPVTITSEPESDQAVSAAPATSAVSETIKITVAGDCRIHVGTDFDARALKRIIDVLRTP